MLTAFYLIQYDHHVTEARNRKNLGTKYPNSTPGVARFQIKTEFADTAGTS
jgi:hypothetical protein